MNEKDDFFKTFGIDESFLAEFDRQEKEADAQTRVAKNSIAEGDENRK